MNKGSCSENFSLSRSNVRPSSLRGNIAVLAEDETIAAVSVLKKEKNQEPGL